MRAAHALRASERAHALALELERTRALLAVVGQATAELSLAHTLETALERVSELLAVDAVAVYLLAEEERLVAAAARGLTGPHARVAERLLELAPRAQLRSSTRATCRTTLACEPCETRLASPGSRRRSRFRCSSAAR